MSISGSYLAARHAGVARDAAAAATYYRAALRGDPRNPELLSRAFMAVLQNGEIDEAVRLAERLLQVDKNERVARLVLGVRAIKQKQYSTARQHLAQSVRGPITDLAATLLQAWTNVGPNESRAAVEIIDKLGGPESYNLLKDLHAGLILDLSGHRRDALKRLERAYKQDASVLRVAQAYGSQLSRLGNRDEALKTFRTFEEALPRHPLVNDAIRDIENGRRLSAAHRHAAGRRRRGPLHDRRGARAARRGCRSRLSAACTLPGAEPCAGAHVACRHLRGHAQTRARHQDL